MIKKIVFAILAIAIGVLGTLAVVYRKDVADWAKRTFSQTEVVEVEDATEEEANA